MTRPAAPRKWRAPQLRAGADARQAAASILDAALAQVRSNAPGALESADPEYLHQLRVGLRRYRSALRVFRKLLRKGPRRQLASAARAAMRPLGQARDWDVLVAGLERIKAPRVLVQRARTRRSAAHELLRPIDTGVLEPGPAAWKKKNESLERFTARVLPRLRRKTLQRAHGLDWTDAGQRHRLRIHVKRLRYAADFLGGRTQALEALQETLGELNDLAVARRLLRDLRPPQSVARRLAAGERRLVALARRQVAALEAED